jgi:hypothetical protein
VASPLALGFGDRVERERIRQAADSLTYPSRPTYADGERRTAAADVANSSVVTMDSVLEQHGVGRIDLLKSDTEGAEWEMFEHCGGWIDRVQSIVIELHGAPLAKLEEHIGHDWTVLQHDTDTRYACETVALTRAAVAAA